MRPLALVLLALAALPLSAQLSESVTVEVVEVPVYVHRGYHPVEGLTRENFEVFVEGQPQPIDYFDVVDMEATPALRAESGAMNVPDLRQRRLFLLLFDMFYTRAGVLNRSRRAAAEFIEKGAPGDAFGVAVLSKAGRFEFVTPFTTDRQAVLAAIGAVRGRSAEHPMRTIVTQGAGGEAWTSLVQTAETNESGGGGRAGGRGGRGGEIESAETGGGVAMDKSRSRPLEKLQEDILLDFTDTVRRLAQLQGHKHVVLLSEGFSLSYDSSHAMALMHKMFEAFQQANTFLHTIDIAGLRHSFSPMDGASLHTLAVGTGGMPQRNTNHFSQLFTEVREQHRYVYVLGFRPRAPKKGHNDIRVKLRNVEPAAAVSYRRGFSTEPGTRTLDGLRLADIVLNDVPQNGIAAEIQTTRSGLRVVIPAAASAAVGGRGEVDLMLYVFDAKNAIVEGRQLRLPVQGQARTLDANFPLRPGRYTAKVLLKAGESVGLATIEFEVK